MGSFRRARGPVGVVLGVRALPGRAAALRVEYRYLRLTGDPVEDAGEHRVRFGVSLLFGNDAP
ncbi:hypothetical protein K8I85_07125 [bacterium]|nr:hypothetical protein [bacterium]